MVIGGKERLLICLALIHKSFRVSFRGDEASSLVVKYKVCIRRNETITVIEEVSSEWFYRRIKKVFAEPEVWRGLVELSEQCVGKISLAAHRTYD